MRLRLDPEDVQSIASAVVEMLRAGSMPGWLDQSASSLGRRRHIDAVRRRMAAGDAGAVQVGRRYLLSAEAHAEELTRAGKRLDSAEDQIAAELGLRVVKGGR